MVKIQIWTSKSVKKVKNTNITAELTSTDNHYIFQYNKFKCFESEKSMIGLKLCKKVHVLICQPRMSDGGFV